MKMAEEKKLLLKVKHVDVKFHVRGRVLNAIRDANLDIYENETIAIVGESGSGKSVLTKTFAGMLDPNGEISHGNVYFFDDDISYTETQLGFRNRRYRNALIKHMCNYTYESFGAEEFEQIQNLNKEIRRLTSLSDEEEEEFEKKLKDINDDINDAFNLIGTLKSTRGLPEEKVKEVTEQREAAKAEYAELKKDKEQLIKDKETAIRERRRSYLSNTALKEEHKAKFKELEEKRQQKIEAAKEHELNDEQKRIAEEVANEIILSVGRYPFYLFYKYYAQLKKAFRLAYDLNKDLSTEKQRRRVFEPIVFRVEYTKTISKETNKIKNIIDETLIPAFAKETVEDEILSNDTVIEQANALHPFLRKKMIKSLTKFAVNNGYDIEKEKDNINNITSIAMVEVGQFDSTIHANVVGNKLIKWFKEAYANKKQNLESISVKSKIVETLVGYAHIDCAKVRYLKDWEHIRGRRIATVFQDPMTSLNPILTIGQQISMVIQKHQKCSTFEARRRALSMMEKVGIPNPKQRFDDYPFQYSGGMRQRIVIAIALSCQPKILICDEPTTALDVTIQAQIIRLIKKLSKDLGFTTVYITHDLGVVANVADRVAVLYGGQIVELGTVEDIFFDPYHPYTWALLSSMPQLGQKGEELFSIPGTPPSLYTKIVGDAFAPRSKYSLAIDFVKEPPMFEINDHHWAKTWLLDPRAPKVEKPESIRNLHEKMVKIYHDGSVK